MVTILDHCPSCGKCSRPGVCPTNAIKVEGGKTFVGEGCIDCDLCIPVCPIGVIVRSDTTEVTTAEWTNAQEELGAESAGKEASTDGESPSTGV